MAQKPGRTSKLTYKIGETVRIQDIRTKTWKTLGEVTGRRIADDGKICSYEIKLPSGYLTICHQRFMHKYLDSSDDTLTADAPTSAGGNGLSDEVAAEGAAPEQARTPPERHTRQPIRLRV